MRITGVIILFFLLWGKSISQDSVNFKGQLSNWLNINPENDLPVYDGIRYIPEMNYNVFLKNNKLIDFEASLNINGEIGFHLFDSVKTDGRIKPYRFWARYSTNQFELRLGLQKINFGSATILRPLMWFDQVDPRDPLQLTDGVWGLLGRYYFLNNANIWLWALYGNDELKTWEITKTNQKFPEVGGRIQTSVSYGEAALSYHFRVSDISDLDTSFKNMTKVPEHRIGLDGKWDVGVGFWYEGAWINKIKNIGDFTNQEILNCGIDYTFSIGNGLNVNFEHLLFSYDKNPFALSNMASFSGFSLSYPIGFFDALNAIIFYDWTNDGLYSFANWKKDFKNLTFFLMAYWNPKEYKMPQQSETANYFAGKGIQLMIEYNH